MIEGRVLNLVIMTAQQSSSSPVMMKVLVHRPFTDDLFLTGMSV